MRLTGIPVFTSTVFRHLLFLHVAKCGGNFSAAFLLPAKLHPRKSERAWFSVGHLTQLRDELPGLLLPGILTV